VKPAERDQARLVEVQGKIRQLSVVSRDDFNLPARYTALVALEAILFERVTGRPHETGVPSMPRQRARGASARSR
jgi:hypothetical protein